MTTLMTQRPMAAERPYTDEEGFSFDFPGMTVGQDYTVKLLLGDVRAHGHRDALLSIEANGAVVLRHGAIVGAASPADGTARVSFVTQADESGQVQVRFSDGFSHKQVLGVEILTGRHLPPAPPGNVTAFAGHNHVQVAWEPVAEATAYTIRRRNGTHGPWHIIATDVQGCTFADLTAGQDRLCQYMVSGINGLGEGDPAAPVMAVLPLRLSVTPQSFEMLAGQSAVCAVLATTAPGLGDAIVLSATGLAAGMAAWFDKAKLAAPTAVAERRDVIDRLHVSADAGVPSGRHELTIRAHYGEFTVALPVIVNIL